MSLRAVVRLIILLLLASQCSKCKPLENVVPRSILISFEDKCDEASAAARVLSSLLAGQPGRHNPAEFKHEEVVVATESLVDFSAYSRTIFSVKTTQFQKAGEAADISEQREGSAVDVKPTSQEAETGSDVSGIIRCSISQTTLKLVGLSVVSLEACPSVESSILKDAFQQDPCVHFVEFDSVVRLNAPQDDITQPDEDGSPKLPAVEYWQELINVEPVDAMGMCRREVVVGVIDSGIAYDHPALEANIWTNTKEVPDNGLDDDGNGYIDDIHGYDFDGRNGDPTDTLGHGTHVAGIIGAVPGHTRASGVCKETSIAALRFMDNYGAGTIAKAIEALNYAVQMGFRVSCNSWGGALFSFTLKHAISQAQKANHLFVTAAGNGGLPVDFMPVFPASFNLPNIITVAASDEQDKLAWFSNYGTITVHLTAPGVKIHSTFPPRTSASLSGTSMAAPFVAAVCAMLFSVKDKSIDKIRQAIFSSVDKLPQLQNRVRAGGRLNVLNALKLYLEDDQPSTDGSHWSPPTAIGKESIPPIVLIPDKLQYENTGEMYFQKKHLEGATANVTPVGNLPA